MDRVTRKSLKDDRFAAEVGHSVEYLAKHRRQTMIYGGVAVAVLALAGGVYFYMQRRSNAAHQALYKALETHHATVSQEPAPGRVSFRTEAEKQAKTLQDFEGVVKDFPRAREGKMARYYLGVVYHEMGKTAEAQKQLELASREQHDNVSALARLTLADIHLSQGKDEEARKAYEYLINNPTDTVSKSRAQLALVRYLRARKPEEARKLLQELIKQPGPVAGAAGNLMREFGQ